MAARLNGVCSICGGPAYRRCVTCRGCGKNGGAEAPHLTVETLTAAQGALYGQIMSGRRPTQENQEGALLEVERATDLEAEALWWQAGEGEPVHQHSGTGLLQEYASV